MKSYRMQSIPCPACNVGLDGVTSVADKNPKPGSITICAYCGTTLIFTGSSLSTKTEIGLRRATQDDLDKLTHEQLLGIAQMRRVVQMMIEQRSHRN
jgi:hypothetical protein